MKNVDFIRVGRKGETTQFLIEARPEGFWSGGSEISIAHELNGNRSQFAPSIPKELIPELVHALMTQYLKLDELEKASLTKGQAQP